MAVFDNRTAFVRKTCFMLADLAVMGVKPTRIGEQLRMTGISDELLNTLIWVALWDGPTHRQPWRTGCCGKTERKLHRADRRTIQDVRRFSCQYTALSRVLREPHSGWFTCRMRRPREGVKGQREVRWNEDGGCRMGGLKQSAVVLPCKVRVRSED